MCRLILSIIYSYYRNLCKVCSLAVFNSVKAVFILQETAQTAFDI